MARRRNDFRLLTTAALVLAILVSAYFFRQALVLPLLGLVRGGGESFSLPGGPRVPRLVRKRSLSRSAVTILEVAKGETLSDSVDPSKPSRLTDPALVIISGPPASGKGTQCRKIQASHGYVHVSVGDLLRLEASKAKDGLVQWLALESGELVEDSVVVDLVGKRLLHPDVQTHGAILDGFPRTVEQAQALSRGKTKVHQLFLIKVPDDVLIERACGRRVDPDTGEIYHLKFRQPPRRILHRLVQRRDDREKVVRARLQTYHAQVDDVLAFFRDNVVEVDGTKHPDHIFQIISEAIRRRIE